MYICKTSAQKFSVDLKANTTKQGTDNKDNKDVDIATTNKNETQIHIEIKEEHECLMCSS